MHAIFKMINQLNSFPTKIYTKVHSLYHMHKQKKTRKQKKNYVDYMILGISCLPKKRIIRKKIVKSNASAWRFF